MTRLHLYTVCLFALYCQSGSGQDYAGTDFRVAFLNNIDPITNGFPIFDFSLEAFENADITIEYGAPADPYYEIQTTTLAANQSGVVTFDGSFYNQLNLNVVETRSFHITSTGDIRVHVFHNRAFFAEASAVLPTSSLGEEYIILTVQNNNNGFPSLYNVIATADNTTVNFVNTNDTPYGNAGDPFSLTLDAGEVVTMAGAGNLSGSTVVSEPGKPVAVFAGHQQTLIGSNCGADNHAFEHMPPTSAWGNLHPIMPVDGNGGDLVRIMALNDNTDIIVGCDVLLTLDEGEVWETTFDTPTILQTSGPALVAQFVSSLECGSLGTGDPNMRIVLPADRANLNLKLENTNGFLQTFGPEIEFFFMHLVMPTSETANIEVNGSPVIGWTEFPDFPGLSYAYWVVNDISVQALNVQSTTPFWSQYVALGMADAMTMATGTMATMEIPNQNTEVVDLGPDLTICPGQEIVLDPGVNTEGIWQDGSTSETFIVTEPGTYSVTISGACDDGFDEIVITEAETVEIDLEPNFSICLGGELSLEVANPGNLEYIWSTGQSGPSITVTSAGIYTVTASVDGFCESEASTEVLESDEPELLISGTTELCVGGTGSLAATGDDGDMIWNNGETGNTLVISGPGTYTATLTTSDGCEATSTYIVESIPGPEPSVSGPEAICNGEIATLVASGESGTYTWGDGTDGPELEINIGGVYTVLLTNPDGCFSEAQFRVDAISDPIIIKPGDLSFCDGAPVAITISSPNGMAFWPDFSEGSVLDVTEPGIYQIAASNECGLVTETLEVEFIDCSCPVYIPNAFTPNGDGLNDIFKPSLGCPVSNYAFEIYNRWGMKIFSTSDENQGWNGATETGGDFFGESGLYIYMVAFQNALLPLFEREVYRGHLNLIR